MQTLFFGVLYRQQSSPSCPKFQSVMTRYMISRQITALYIVFFGSRIFFSLLLVIAVTWNLLIAATHSSSLDHDCNPIARRFILWFSFLNDIRHLLVPKKMGTMTLLPLKQMGTCCT